MLLQVFSHMCTRYLEKELPPSLCVDDVQTSCHSPWLPSAMRSPVLVLVAGDVAQTVSAESLCPGPKPARFLYAGRAPPRARPSRRGSRQPHGGPAAGSEFERNRAEGWSPHDELDPGYVQLVFYSSVTVFTIDRRDCVWRPRDTAPVESSLVVLPRVLPESRLAWFTRAFEHSIRKCAQDSTWLVERGGGVDAYSERGLQPRWILKRMRLRARQSQEPAQPAQPEPTRKRQRLA